jgi:hypothetical protein
MVGFHLLHDLLDHLDKSYVLAGEPRDQFILESHFSKFYRHFGVTKLVATL